MPMAMPMPTLTRSASVVGLWSAACLALGAACSGSGVAADLTDAVAAGGSDHDAGRADAPGSADAASDVISDTAVLDDADAPGPDASPDASPDTMADAVADAIAETTSDTSPDTVDAEPPPDATSGDADTGSPPDVPPDEVGAPGCLGDDDCAHLAAGSCAVPRCDLDTGACFLAPIEGADVPCDDGNPCSVGDHCQGGKCAGAAPLDCDDGNPCTDDLCLPGDGCIHLGNFAACDDGDPCTGGDQCVGGVCEPAGPECDDGNPCTDDACEPQADGSAVCVTEVLDGQPCDDGDACTAGDVCVGALCVGGGLPGCDDGNPCTEDVCDEDAGTCLHTLLADVACDDGDACTDGDLCQDGSCVPGPAVVCPEPTQCSVVTCEPAVGCLVTRLAGKPCDDGSACTAGDVCGADGTCVGPVPVGCDDGKVCTEDACLPETGCAHEDLVGPCDDGDPCTSGDHCAAGECTPDKIGCDDDDVCTMDTCDPLSGCVYTDLSGDCDDLDPCTVDSCDPKFGCLAQPAPLPCDDGDACTADDTCTLEGCFGEPLLCDDADPCTMDSCDPASGCSFDAYVGPCDDGDPCTEGEVCDDLGVCAGGLGVDPDDGIDCTLDACDSELGIQHVPDDGVCAEGLACHPIKGCVTGDVRLILTKVLLLPAAAAAEEGAGQWFQLVNRGTVAIDLTTVLVGNDDGEFAQMLSASGDVEPVLVAPGGRVAAIKRPLVVPDDVPEGFALIYGAPGDGFSLSPAGETIRLRDSFGDVLETLTIDPVATGPEVPAGAFPVVVGAPLELSAPVALAAADASANDDGDAWCAWAAGSGGPTGDTLDCDRVRLNEISLAGDDGARWVELHQPAGGAIGTLKLRFIDATGYPHVPVTVAPGGRAPIGAAVVVFDQPDGLGLPQLADGAVQLFRSSALLDVYGFGALDVLADTVVGQPMVEGAAGPAQEPGKAAARLHDGVDSDDNTVDWIQVDGGSPGELNAP